MASLLNAISGQRDESGFLDAIAGRRDAIDPEEDEWSDVDEVAESDDEGEAPSEEKKEVRKLSQEYLKSKSFGGLHNMLLKKQGRL